MQSIKIKKPSGALMLFSYICWFGIMFIAVEFKNEVMNFIFNFSTLTILSQAVLFFILKKDELSTYLGYINLFGFLIISFFLGVYPNV